MIHCKAVNNSQYSLEERAEYFSGLQIDGTIPHVFLQTCNRIELYWGEGNVIPSVIRHLYRVASGLESEIIGERAIQGQLKKAYQTAISKYKLSPELNRLFQTAIHTGKRVRTETKISEGAVSYSLATVNILKETDIDLKNTIVTIIGVNKLTEDILKFLKAKKKRQVYFLPTEITIK